jgi:tetratricopeptide (TPR) repeat protein
VPGANSVLDTVDMLLRAGDIGGAVTRLAQTLQQTDDPELRLLYAQLSHFSCDYGTARTQLEAAVAAFQSRGMPRRAAVAASSLARVYHEGWGNRVVGSAWLRRAAALLDGEAPCVEQGWVAVGLIGCDISDAAVLEAKARMALDLARRFGDLRLEAQALADSGLALVSFGQIDEGMGRLDEAMALTMSPGIGDPVAISMAGCCMFTACERAGDLARAEAWLRITEELGIYTPENALAVAHCGATYGALLREVGRWQEAEPLLVAGVEAGERSGHFFSRLEARAALADLRIRQGRLAEAEQLLLGLDDRVEALLPLARLYAARGDYDLAVAVARRGVRLLGADRLRSAPLLLATVEAELGRGDLEAAAATAAELAAVAAQAGQPTPMAQAALATARVATAAARPADAVDCLEEALAILGPDELPLLRAAIHFALARVHADDHARAVADTRAALALHQRAGAPIGPDEARLLRDLGLAPPCGITAIGASLRRDGAYWTIRYGGAVARLRDAKGLAYLAELLTHPGVERHVFDLVDLVEGVPAEPGLDRRRLGDAGPCLDAQAKRAYRHRLEQLREAMDDADARGDQPAAEEIQAEIDALIAELSRGMGLLGRDRRAASAAEKARLNVTRAVRAAIARIEQAHPPLGEHLGRHVRTGTFCSYQPGAESGVAWGAGSDRPGISAAMPAGSGSGSVTGS